MKKKTPFAIFENSKACVPLDCRDLTKPAELKLPPRAKSGAYAISWAQPAIFEYIIRMLGDSISALHLNCCPRLHDLTPLEALPNLRSLYINWNQKATALWDMAKNPRLEALALQSFRRVQDLRELEAASHVTVLELKGDLEKKWKIASLWPLASLTSLESLTLWEVTVRQDGFYPLHGLRQLRDLNASSNIFPVEDYARLAAALPDAKSDLFGGTWSWTTERKEETGESYEIELIVPVGKGGREWRADIPGGLEKKERYRKNFADMMARFRGSS